MPVLLAVLAVGVFLWLYWRHRTTTLTRDCRWRQNRDRGHWRCAFCGALRPGNAAPRDCLRPPGHGRERQGRQEGRHRRG